MMVYKRKTFPVMEFKPPTIQSYSDVRIFPKGRCVKLTLTLLLVFSAFTAQAQNPPPGTGNLFDSRAGGLLPGFRGRQEIDFAAEAERRRQENNRFSVPADNTRTAARCTPIAPGSSNVVANPCPAGSGNLDSWGLVPAGPSCNVTYTEIKDVSYGPAEDNLHGILIKGQHNAPAGAGTKSFEVLDLDGFLVLAAIHSSWQSNLLVQANQRGQVNLPMDDIKSALRVVRMGQNYFPILLRNARTANAPNMAAIETEINAKLSYLRTLGAQLESWERNGGVVARNGINQFMSTGLERFAPGSSDRLYSQYRDLSLGNTPQILCNPQAQSELVGQVLCSRNFVTSAQRSPNFCAGGISFNRLSSLPVCSIANGVPGVCRPSLYAQSTSDRLPFQLQAPGASSAGAR